MPGFQEYLDAYSQVYAPNATSTADNLNFSGSSDPSILSEITRLLSPQQAYQAVVGQQTQRGVRSQSPVEWDFRNLTPMELEIRYGAAGDQLLRSRVEAGSQLYRDASAARNWHQFIWDTAGDVTAGFGGAVGGIATLGAGAVDRRAGVAVSHFMDRALQRLYSQHSEPLQGHRRIDAAKAANDARENELEFNQDLPDDGDFIASLRRFGRGAARAVRRSFEDPMVFSSDASQAGGSLLAAGPATKLIRAAAGPAASLLGRTAVARGVVSPFNTVLPRVANVLPGSIAIGAMEGGGAYQQTVSRIMQMDHETLLQTSPAYAELIAQGVPPEQAKIQIADQAGKEAALIQAPIGAATGALVARFEANPLVHDGRLVDQMLKEAVEEGIQSGSSQLASNFAVQQNADTGQALSEDVGEQSGFGALHGASSAGIVGAPGAAGRHTLRSAAAGLGVAKKAGKDLWSALERRRYRIEALMQRESPVSDENVGAAVSQVNAQASEFESTIREAIDSTPAAPEDKQQAHSYVDNVLRSVRFDESELDEPNMPEPVREALRGSRDRFDAISRLTDLVENNEDGSTEQLTAARYLNEMIDRNVDLTGNQLVRAIQEVPDDHPALPQLRQFEDAMLRIRDSSRVQRVRKAADEIAQAAREKGQLNPIEKDELATPEGHQKILNQIAISETTPLQMKPEAIDRILFHADNGDVQLTTPQRVNLNAAKQLLEAQRTRQAEIERLGLPSNNDVVSKEITTKTAGGDERSLPSAAEHVKRIMGAVRSGDRDMLAANLHNFVQFAEHMQGKVAALNKHLKIGNGQSKKTGPDGKKIDNTVSYQVLLRNGQHMKSAPFLGMWVNKFRVGPVRNAQAINNDAKVLATLANHMVEMFPDLGVDPVKPVELDPSLTFGTPEEVAQAHIEGRAPMTEKPAEEPVKKTEPAETVEVPVETPSKPEDADQLELPLDKKVEQEPSTPVSEDPDQSKGGDQSTETEVKTEPEAPVSEEKPEPNPEPEPETAVEQVEEPVQPKTIQEAFPNLIGSSWITKIFRLPEQAKSRILSTASPLSAVRSALASAESLSTFIGSKLKHTFSNKTANEYARLMAIGDNLKTLMNERLSQALAKTRGGRTVGEILQQNLTVESKDGKREYGPADILRFRNFKALSLVEDHEGELGYNEQLLEGAVLAGLQWLLTASRQQSRLDQEDVAELTGIESPSAELVQNMNSGLGLIEAKRSLAAKIKSFWGLSETANAPIGQLEGIPEAIASELLHAMVEANVLAQGLIELDESDGLPPLLDEDGARQVNKKGEPLYNNKTFHIFSPITKVELKPEGRRHPFQDPENPIYAFPDAIEQAIQLEPERANFFIDELPPSVPETQLRNSQVKLTDDQKKAIAFEQEQAHFANVPLINLMKAMGLTHVLSAFGAGDLSKKGLNDQDRKSKDGVNRTIASAFGSLVQLVSELESRATTAGTDMDKLPIRFGYTFTRVNRMQMLGLNNPQSSKLMREAVLPTRSTLDLSVQTSKDFSHFVLGLAQALGIKVHQISREEAARETFDLLNGQLAEPVNVLREWLNSQDRQLTIGQVDILVSGLGQGMAPVALHAVLEYARYLNADESGRKSFTTSLYVEADGVTNGPANAMVLLANGFFNSQWLRNARKVGLFIGSSDRTMNFHREFVDGADLYQTVTGGLIDTLGNIGEIFQAKGPISEQLTRLLRLMDTFMPDVTLENEEKPFSRGIAKNPLTITIYGSGAKGIANKVAGQLVEEIYQRFSQAMQARDADNSLSFAQAMFPNAIDAKTAEQQFAEFWEIFAALTTKVARRGREGWYLGDGEKTDSPSNRKAQTFELTKGEFENLSQNMLNLFVHPLRSSISRTVGDDVMRSADVLRQAVQVQSIVLEYAYKAAIEKKLQEKEAADPSWNRSDFLTRKELREVFKSLGSLATQIDTGAQRYFISGSDTSNIGDDQQGFGSSLADQMRTPAFVQGLKDAGVAGIPAMVIGSGDGMMMQILSTMDGAPDRTLKIFDGMNMPLDAIEEFSQKANQAVFQSWMGNPLQAVLKAYTSFLDALGTESVQDMTAAEKKALSRAFGSWDKVLSHGELNTRIQGVRDELQELSDQAEARHQVLNRVGLTVDQMAAVGAPYVHEGEISLEGLSDDQILIELNRLYDEEISKIRQDRKLVSEEISAELKTVGRQLKSGAREVSFTALKQLARKMKIPDQHRAILNDIVKSLTTKEYKIVFGTPEQIRIYAEERGKLLPAQLGAKGVNGFISPADRTIYLHAATSETLVHELVHAATIDKVDAVYEDRDLGPNGVETIRAVERLEQLMDRFLSIDITSEDAETQEAYLSAVSEIEKHQAAGDKAAALNEFMAWGLSNSRLVDLGKRIAVNPLVQLARSIIDGIKKLIWGRRQTPDGPTNDLFSNLRFNAAIVMQAKVTPVQLFRETALFHNKAYGVSDRLAEFNRVLGSKLFRHFRQTASGRSDKAKDLQARNKANDALYRSDLFHDVMANGFPMNEQERTTFRLLTAVMSTTAELDPNALARVQDIYAHVTKNLKVEDFMANPDSTHPADRAYALEKYDVIVGKMRTDKDPHGRSSLLPAFLALAIVNEEFRSILAKMDLPKTERNGAKTLDALLENVGNSVMDNLTLRVSGEGAKSDDVRAAIDALTQRIMETAEDRRTFMQQMAHPWGNAIDRANEIVTDAMSRLAATLEKKGADLQDQADSKTMEIVGQLTRTLGGILDVNTAQQVAENHISALNRGNVPQTLRELIGDFIGRTASNAQVYDMIKRVRSWVQQARQQYREHLPSIIEGKFTRKLTDAEKTAMFHGMGKTDLAALRPAFSEKKILSVLADKVELNAAIDKLELRIQQLMPNEWNIIRRKAQQLAHFMITGEPGSNLLRNAEAVTRLLNEGINTDDSISPDAIKTVDQLVTLYAIGELSEAHRDSLAALAQTEAEGLTFTLARMVGLRKAELSKVGRSGTGLNHYKGYMPVEFQPGQTLVVANDEDHKQMVEKSFVRIGTYEGSRLDRGSKLKSYYFAPVSGRALYHQGIFQNVRPTVYGVDLITGLTHGLTAGVVDHPGTVQKIARQARFEKGKEPLLPVFNYNGRVVAYERSIDPAQLQRLSQNTDLPKVIGIWAGRQLEETAAQEVNKELINKLHTMWSDHLKKDPSAKDEYVNLFDRRMVDRDPVLKDAVNLLSGDTLAYANSAFGEQGFWVRKDLLNDALGYRAPSVGDFWTGNTRLPEKVADVARTLAVNAFGNNAYKYLTNAERLLQTVVTDARVLIVVKSVVVPVTNMIANVYQLWSRGVPIVDIGRNMPRKMAEVNAYLKTRLRLQEAEAELEAAHSDPILARKLRAEMQSITDSHKRMSIWPLIEAGEFSSISDGTITHEELTFTDGRLSEYIEKKVDQLPGWLRNMGRYAIISRDTALFQGLQRAVEYGDFLAKAVLFEDLTKRKKLSREEALARVTEEFVNYDRLPGRARGYAESMGLLWFWNFKIRTTKVALSMIRNNPVHTLLSMAAPAPTMFGTVGNPVGDNIISMGLDGRLDWSIGPGMGLRAHDLFPWVNLVG